MNYRIEWENEHPELTEEQSKKLASELAYLTEQLEQPGDLIFHHVWLTEDTDGPVIMVYGKDEVHDTFFMTYYEETEWVTLDYVPDAE
jgi:hypothetical protein